MEPGRGHRNVTLDPHPLTPHPTHTLSPSRTEETGFWILSGHHQTGSDYFRVWIGEQVGRQNS